MDPFKQLYDKYKKDIYHYLFYLSGDSFIAEDLTQETFLGAYQSLHRFKGESKVSTWLFQIAKYTFYGFLRKKEKNTVITDDFSNHVDESNTNTPEQIHDQKEEVTTILNALKQLKQPKQHIVILRIYNNLSYKDIGEIFDQSELWARVNFHRAKNELGVIIERGAYDEPL